jgi:D-aspartate ligase
MPFKGLDATAGVPEAGAVPHIPDLKQKNMAPVALVSNDWAPTLAFAVSLGRQGVPLHMYGHGAVRWSRYCRRRRSCPPVEYADLFLPWLEARVKSGEIARLAPTTDLIAYYLAVLRDSFPADVRRAITPLDEIELCLIKTRFTGACEATGRAVPTVAAPDDPDGAVLAARALGYPVIVKPKSHLVVGVAARGRLVRDEEELRRVYRRYAVAPGQGQIAAAYPELRWPMLQRYLPSALECVYSISGIKDADRGILVANLTTKREQWPPHVGVSTVQAVCNDDRILSAGLATVDKLVSRGIFEIELLTHGDELMAIDLNPRAFGFIMLDMAVGNDLPWLWWQTTLGPVEQGEVHRSVPALEARFAVPYYFAHGIRSILGPRAAANESGPGGRPAPWVSMVGHRSDPIPMLLAHMKLFRLLPHRGGLVRPFLDEAWQTRRGTKGRPP